MYSTFKAFQPHFDALARVAYYKLVSKSVSRTKLQLHNIYRVIIWILIIAYNFQHMIRVIMTRHSTDEMVNTLFILLTTLNALGKQAAFNVRSARLDRIIDVINGPLFAPTKPHHVEVMKKNALAMSRLLKLYHAAIFICASLWAIFPLINRALGEDVQFTGYIPFDTSTSPSFELALAYMSILIAVQAYGNVTMDCTIVAFYAQAKTQILILRYNIEQLVNVNTAVKNNAKLNKGNTDHISFKDIEDGHEMQRRLKYCVKHYKQIAWFAKEVESIFGEVMVVQFLVMSWVICMTVYKIIGLNIISAEFISMTAYLGCMLAQLFIYCYFGTQLKAESEFVNQSIYFCDWLSLSPRFRRQLLVMMEYCSRPLAPRTAYVIPMSLETYIAVLRSSYTLFTFLNRK